MTNQAHRRDGRTDMPWIIDDGGRAAAGHRGNPGDCVARAISIVLEIPYAAVCEGLTLQAARERPRAGRRSSPLRGVKMPTIRRYLEEMGWTWHPTMEIGGGCRVHLCREELPAGRLVVSVSRHLTAVIDHVIHDTHDPQRGTVVVENGISRVARRCVYGFWTGRPLAHTAGCGPAPLPAPAPLVCNASLPGSPATVS